MPARSCATGARCSPGGKGAGKTTTALLLARYHGWELLANDRVFVRADPSGVRVLPWPAAATIGLGLLDALGLYDLARNRSGLVSGCIPLRMSG